MPALPIFEQSTSTLYYSNDGRLCLAAASSSEWVVALDGREVLRTRERVVVDAYIAGYDLATDRDRRQHNALIYRPISEGKSWPVLCSCGWKKNAGTLEIATEAKRKHLEKHGGAA